MDQFYQGEEELIRLMHRREQKRMEVIGAENYSMNVRTELPRLDKAQEYATETIQQLSRDLDSKDL